MRTVATAAATSVPDLRRRIVVMVRPVVHVVMPSTDHAVTNHVVTTTNAAATVMILHAATSGATRAGRPLVAAVRIVKQRVLVRLRIRVQIAVDLGLQLVGDGGGRRRRS